MENIHQIILRSKLLADRLRLSLLAQNNLIADGFNITDVEFSKPLTQLEERLVSTEKKLKFTQEEVASAKQRLTEMTHDYNTSLEENASLLSTKDELVMLSERLQSDHHKVQRETQNKLKTYRTITGIRFDLNTPKDILTGYVAISGNNSLENVIVPFTLNKNVDDNQELWEKIRKACSDVCECNQ